MAIIVATGLGPYDHDAREVAGLLAKRMDEAVILVHVLEQHEPAPPVMRELLRRAAHEMSRFGGAVEEVLLRGDATTSLTEYARTLHPRLIIIGGPAPADARGLGQRRKARHLLDTLRVPVLCVPHAADLLQTLHAHDRLRLLVSRSDDAASNAAMLNEAHALRDAMPCTVSVLCASGDDTHRAGSLPGQAIAHDVLVLDAGALESTTAWPFSRTAKPMLFVSKRPQTRAPTGDAAASGTSGRNDAASPSNRAQSVSS